jgi:5-methylcytosine-specific restriction endonuclease McrA
VTTAPPPGPPKQWVYMQRESLGPVALSRDVVYGSAWRRVRRLVLERDGYRCRIGGPGCLVDADQVDHIVSWRVGGAALDPENLRASCSHCNAVRGGALGGSKPSVRRPSREW